jgi:hypothetical protein
VQQLAGEVALQAIRDLRMLRKRGMVKGMKIIKDHQGVPLNDALEYKNSHEVQKLLRDFKTGVVSWWCRASGVQIDNRTLLRKLKEKDNALPS